MAKSSRIPFAFNAPEASIWMKLKVLACLSDLVTPFPLAPAGLPPELLLHQASPRHATLLLSCSLLFPTSKHHRQHSSGVLYICGCCLITFSFMCWYRLWALRDHQPCLPLLSVLSSFSTWYPAWTENEQRVQWMKWEADYKLRSTGQENRLPSCSIRTGLQQDHFQKLHTQDTLSRF